MIKKIDGVVLTETPLGESSKIINLFTKEKGIIGIVCKNAKNIRNPLRTKTEKFTYGTFHIEYNENKLSKLIDVDIIDSLKNIKSDITLISYLSYVTDLTHQVARQNDSSEIYDIYLNAILKMNEKQDPLILMNIVETKYLNYLGIGLNLDCCIECGSTENIVTIDPDKGGYICKDCYTNEKILNPKSVKLLRIYNLIDIKTISKIDISPEVKNEINEFLDKYYERYAGLYLKSKKFLKNIISIS